MSFLTGVEMEKSVKATKNLLMEEPELMTRKMSEILYYLKFANLSSTSKKGFVFEVLDRM